MSLDYHFKVEQEAGSATFAFFSFNGNYLWLFFFLFQDLIRDDLATCPIPLGSAPSIYLKKYKNCYANCEEEQMDIVFVFK